MQWETDVCFRLNVKTFRSAKLLNDILEINEIKRVL